MNTDERHDWFDSTAAEWEDQYLDQGLRGRQVRKRMGLTIEYLDEERLPQGARILDLGCGPGIIAEAFAARGFRVYCVDFSSELLLRARDRLKGRGSALPHLAQADAHALPFGNGAMDAITCVGVISWVEDPAKVLREMARVLRPGGVLIITAINRFSIEYIFDPLFWWRQLVPPAWRASLRGCLRFPSTRQGEETGPRLQQFAPRRFDKMLQRAGFAKTRWRTIKYGHFRFFGRRVFPAGAEVAIDRALDRLWWAPMIRRLGWLYFVKVKREGGETTPLPDRVVPNTHPGRGSVLILGNYRQTLTVIRSMARAGFGVILGMHDKRAPGKYSRYVSEIWRHPPIASEEESFVASLKRFVVERPDITWVFPVGENQLECLVRHIEEIPFRSKLVMTDPGVALTCLDKTGLYRVATELGIPTPEFMNVQDIPQLFSAAGRIGYPCVVKPNSSQRQFFDKKAIICRTSADLRSSFGAWPEGEGSLIVQKYVDGARINCHFAARNGSSRAHFEYVTTWTNRIDKTGIAVEGVSIRQTPRIEKYCDLLLKRMNYSGVGCIQFLLEEKSQDLYFLELNPRLSATTAFPYQLGFDTPMMALDCVSGREDGISPAAGDAWTYPVGKRVHWLLGDLEGLLFGIKNGEFGFLGGVRWAWRMAKAFVRADVHVTWYWRDPLPTLFMHAKLTARVWHWLTRSHSIPAE